MFLAPLLLVLLSAAADGAEGGYRKPPRQVLDVLNAPLPPNASVNPPRTHALFTRSRRYPPIAEVARPMLRLAGVRIDPRTNGPHGGVTLIEMKLVRLADGAEQPLALPPGGRFGMPRWSPNGKWFAFTVTAETGIELWAAGVDGGKAARIPGVRVNAAYGEPFQWMPDSGTLLVQTVPATRGAPPAPPETPPGPKIQEGRGRYAPVRTYQDLLASTHDEALFDFYGASQLVLVEVPSGRQRPYGAPAVYRQVEPAPDGRHVLVTRVHRPYSYLHTHSSFPQDLEVWDAAGKLVKKVASLPLADAVPIDGVRTGPRNMRWRPGSPAALVWTEALDGGNPKEKVPHRDRLLVWSAPFTGEPGEILRTEHRMTGTDWGADGLLLARDYDRDKRWSRTFLLRPGEKQDAAKMIFSRGIQDRYNSPGEPVEMNSPLGERILVQSGDEILLRGSGATPKGDRPFLARYNLKTGVRTEIFRSAENAYETVEAVLAPDGSRFLTERQSPGEPPNFHLRAASGESKALTHYADPAPALRGITKQLVSYKRADGVALSFTLYLPPGYREGARLPTVLWAYPREFNDPDTAGQVAGSPNRFTTITGTSHLFYLLAGYAVLDNAAMPVVGSPETVNDTYVEQIVMNAKAAIDKAAEMGVTDPNRVGVGGHSYGAFMTANLLAHCDLFRAGVARSGAYNRTLTPFGFQSERRTLWEAPQLYLKMSPFLVADKIKEPLLLIHGEADNNPGTFPIQTERMYQAVRGNGGTVRYVLLPHESHGYTARESVEHTLYEMISWFDRHVKGEK